MENFISLYPNVILNIFIVLLMIVGWGLRTSFNKFATALQQNTLTLNTIEARLTTQETICEICRQHCPYQLKDRQKGEVK